MSAVPAARSTVLVLDTATRHEAAALVGEAGVLGCLQLEKPRGRVGLGIADLRRVLEESALELSDVTDLLVVDGPGSFSGVRSGIALLQGLSRGLGLPLWSASATRCRALQCEGEQAPVAVAMDARRSEVYVAAYASGGKGEELLPPRVLHASAWASELAQAFPGGVRLVGEGAWANREVFSEVPGIRLGDSPSVTPAVAALGQWLLQSGRTRGPAPSWPVPRYLRACQAERERAARLALEAGPAAG